MSSMLTFRAAMLLSLVLALASCRETRVCRDGTLFLRVVLPSSVDPRSVQALDIAVLASDGNTIKSGTVALMPAQRSGTVEVTLGKDYPAEQTVTVAVAARRGDVTLAVGFLTPTLPDGCSAFDISLSAASPPPDDGGSGEDDGGSGSTDGGAADSVE